MTLTDLPSAYQTLFEGSPLAMYIYDPETLAVVEVNAAAVRQYGWSRAEFLRMDLKDMRPLDEVPALLKAIKERRTLGPSPLPIGIFTHRRKDGSRLRVSITNSALDVNGKKLGLSVAHDVTALLAAQEEASQSRQDLKLILESSPGAVHVADLQGRLLMVNKSFEALFQVERSRVLGETYEDVFPRPTAAAFRDGLAAALASREEVQSEETIPDEDGSHADYVFLRFCLRGSGGAPTAVCSIATDVTDLHRAERTLGESEQRYRCLADSGFEAILIHDQGVIIDVNRAACELFGLSRRQLLGSSWLDRVAPAFRDKTRLAMAQDQSSFEIELLRQGGPAFAAEFSGKDAAYLGRRVRVVSLRDITDRKRAQEAEARLAALVESSEDPIMSGTLDGVVSTWNPAAEKLFGWSAAEMIGRSFSVLLPPGREHEFRDAVLGIKTGKRISFNTQRMRKDGALLNVSVRVLPLRDANGCLCGGAVTMHDLSDRHRAELEAGRLAAIVESSDDVLISASLEGLVETWNPASEKLFGWTAAEMLGQPLKRLLPPGQELEFQRCMLRMKDGDRDFYETRRMRKDGALVDVSVRVLPLKDLQGGLCGLAVTMHDLTARKRAVLREARFQVLSESGILGITISDSQGGIKEVNDTFLRMSGYSRADFEAGRMDWNAMTPPEWLYTNVRAISQLNAKGFADPWEKEYFRKDGSRWPVLIGIARLPDVERHNIVFFLDLTELRRVQRSLNMSRRTLDVEARDRRRAGRDLTDQVARLLSAAQGKAAGGVKELLAQALSQTQRISEDLLPTVLEQKGLCAAVGALAKGHSRAGFAVDVVHQGFPRRLGADVEVALYRIVQEALRNAELHSGAKRVVVTLRRDGALLKVSVKDDGKGGVSKAGDGLSGMRERACLIGAELEVGGTPRKGTEVFLSLPYGRVKGKAAVFAPSAREAEVLALIADGLSSREMAARLGISARTVETHRQRLMDRLGIHSAAALTKYAIEKGFVRLR